MCTSTALVADALPEQPASVTALSTACRSTITTSAALVALHVEAAVAGVPPTATVTAAAITSSPAPTQRRTDAPAVLMVPPWFMCERREEDRTGHRFVRHESDTRGEGRPGRRGAMGM